MNILAGCKLTYFPVPGRGESIRLALAIGGIAFTDERVDFSQWKELKPTTPWGSLPVLTLADGTTIAQQRSILRFVGKHVDDLYPSDPLRAARCDELMDALEDVGVKTNAAGQGLEQAEKEAKRKEAVETGAVAQLLEKVDAYIGAQGSAGHSVGDKMTVADLMLFAQAGTLISGLFDGVPLDCLDRFGNIQALRKAVAAEPACNKWLKDWGEGLPKSFSCLL